MSAQDIGNHHFGAVSKTNVLISKPLALNLAGLAQIKAGTSRPEWKSLGLTFIPTFLPIFPFPTVIPLVTLKPPYGDDPVDQMWIMEGFNYYEP